MYERVRVVLQCGWRNRGEIQATTEDTELLRQPCCAWYVIMDSVPGYNINNTYIRQIEAMFQAKKGSKNTGLKGMDKFLQAELEAGQTEVARHGKEHAEEPYQKRL